MSDILKQNTSIPLPTGLQEGVIVEKTELKSENKFFSQPEPLKDFQLFSLGPVYVYANVDRDLIAEFQRESEQFDTLTLRYAKPVFTGLNEWDFILQALPKDIFPFFSEFLSKYFLIDSGSKTFYEVNGYWCPFAKVTEDQIGVFTPSGNKFRVTVYNTYPIAIVKIAPNTKVIEKAKRYFSLNLN